MNTNPTHFINLDVDLESDHDLSPLTRGLGSDVVDLERDESDGVRRITYELATEPENAEIAIVRFVARVDALPADALETWRAARKREFNVGIEAGSTFSYELTFSPELVREVARLGASLGVTIYAPE